MRPRFPLVAMFFVLGASLAPGCRCSDDPPPKEAAPPAKSGVVLRTSPFGKRIIPKLGAIPPRTPPSASGPDSSAPPPPQAPASNP